MWQSAHVTPRWAMMLPAYSSAFGILAIPVSVWHWTQRSALATLSWRGSHLPWNVWQLRQVTSVFVKCLLRRKSCHCWRLRRAQLLGQKYLLCSGSESS